MTSQHQKEQSALSEKIAVLEKSLEIAERTQKQIKAGSEARDHQQSCVLEKSLKENHQKYVELIDRKTRELQGRIFDYQDSHKKMGELETSNRSLVTLVNRLEEENHEQASRISSQRIQLEHLQTKSSQILDRYERGELNQSERLLVSKVHDAAQISQQRDYIEKCNEIARV